MLCRVCASIDLRDGLGPVPDDPDILLEERFGFSPRNLHYESYGGIVSAAKSCQLCALVVASFPNYFGWTPALDCPMYRSVKRDKRENDLFPTQARRLTVMNFGSRKERQDQGLEFCSIKLYVEDHTRLATRQYIVGRPIKPADDPEQLLKWFNECDQSHEKCRLSPPSAEYPVFMPMRVLDVGSIAYPQLRLREGSECSGAYATLSHCWGTAVKNRTTKSTLHTHMESIELSRLCKTMRDAVTVTRNLQIEYLWIDALCIVQDDSEDWAREAGTMADVYTQSAITIAATSSPDGDGGCFFPRSTGPTAKLRWTLMDRTPPEQIHFRKHEFDKYRRLVEKGPLNQRAWVMQERSLSRRIVHYTTECLYWECQEGIFEEGFTEVSFVTVQLVKGFELFHKRMKTGMVEDTYLMDQRWYEMVKLYSRAQLTYKSDRLPAFAGLAKTWAKASGDRYIAGCWQANLPLSLCWVRQRAPETSVGSQLPSWSWVSMDSAIWSVASYGQKSSKKIQSFVEDIVVTINGSATAEIYAGVDEGLLTLTGRVKSTIFRGIETPKDYLAGLPWLLPLDPLKKYANNTAIFDREPVFGTPVPLLQLCGYSTESERTRLVMLLQPLELRDHFKRIGLGVIIWNPPREEEERENDHNWEVSWFDDAPEVRITIS